MATTDQLTFYKLYRETTTRANMATENILIGSLQAVCMHAWKMCYCYSRAAENILDWYMQQFTSCMGRHLENHYMGTESILD